MLDSSMDASEVDSVALLQQQAGSEEARAIAQELVGDRAHRPFPRPRKSLLSGVAADV